MKKTILFVCCIMSMVVFVGGCGKSPERASLWGQADAKELDINSKIPGRVVEILVTEGEAVKKGQLLARIDKRELVTQVEQTQAAMQSLAAQSEQAALVTRLQEVTAESTLKTAQAQFVKAEADMKLAENDFIRFQNLMNSGAVSKQTFEAYKTKHEVAQATLEQAIANARAAEAGILQKNINMANEAALNSKLIQAKASLEQVNISLGETEIYAPFDGIVTTKYVEVGAMISQGTPIVAMQDPSDNWVNFKVKETELSGYTLNKKVSLRGRDDKLVVEGVIVDISKKPEFATFRATGARGDSDDIIAFNVKVRTNSVQVRPGMRFCIGNEAK